MTRNLRPNRPPRLAALALAATAGCGAHAFEIDTGNQDLKLRWDTTVMYSAAARLHKRSPGLSQTAFGPTGIVGPNNVNSRTTVTTTSRAVSSRTGSTC
jgi:hypothetical protein